MKNTVKKYTGPLIGLILFVSALWVLHHELNTYHLSDITNDLKSLPIHSLLFALLLTILSYTVLTGYDTLALKYIRHPLPYKKIAFASFCGYSISNNLGLTMLTGGSMRYRLYSSWGLSILEITKVVAFCSMTFSLGFLTLGSSIFTFRPTAIPQILHFPILSTRPIGILFFLVIVLYLFLAAKRYKPITFRGFEFPIPSPGLALSQMIVSTMDWSISGSVLFVLLPKSSGISWIGFMSIYMLAQIAGLISQLPGGLGVFEALILTLLPGNITTSQIIGSLVVYRSIYYLLPLFAATALIGIKEAVTKRAVIQKITSVTVQWSSVIVPQLLATGTFVCGIILLFSGALPSVEYRLNWLKFLFPLPMIEFSHLLGSISGAGLLILSRGLYRRIDAAYNFTVIMLGSGILFSLFKGFDFEEAIILSVMLGALIPNHRYFYRKSSLTSLKYSPYFITAIILVLMGTVWIGLFSYKHIEYSHDLWWNFTLHGDAPRFLRATVGVAIFGVMWSLATLLRPAQPEKTTPGHEDWSRITDIVNTSPNSYAHLAYLGDKSFLFSEKGNAFIMYGIKGKSWIVMGDPIGTREEWPSLIGQFREMCERYDGWPVFYEVRAENLYLYLDQGFTFFKIGEEARIPLENFSLEGSARKALRYSFHKLEKEGCRFEIIPVENIPMYMAGFKEISDEWLKSKNTHEKGFSLGFFDEHYLRRFPAGIIRLNEKIIAFTNIWTSSGKEELSIDLMRHTSDAPGGVMEYLFINLMLWGRQEGYSRFNFGLVPLSGMESHEFAPLWNRFGVFIYRYGEHFYNFQGLRYYKDKFDPKWEPKYLAAPGGFMLPQILLNVASLVSGGVKGIVLK